MYSAAQLLGLAVGLDRADGAVRLGLGGGEDIVGFLLRGGDEGFRLGAGVLFDVLGELLRGDERHVHGLLRALILADLVGKVFHLRVERGDLLLGGSGVIGELVEKIIDLVHGVPADAGLLKTFFADVLGSDHIFLLLSGFCFLSVSAVRRGNA